MTALAFGSGWRVEAVEADVDRIDIGDQPAPALQPFELLAQRLDPLAHGGIGRRVPPPASAISSAIASSSCCFGPLSAMRRPWLLRMVRPTLMLVGEPVIAKPARRGLKATDLLEVELDHVGKLEILEEEVEHLLARQHEPEIVLGLAPAQPGARPATCRRPGLAMRSPGMNSLLPGSTWPRRPLSRAFSKVGSLVPLDRHGDAVLGVHVGDLAGPDLVPDGALQLVARAPQEALAIAEALVLRVETAVDEVRHDDSHLALGCSARLVHPHVPVHQPPDLTLGIAALDHALHELACAVSRSRCPSWSRS